MKKVLFVIICSILSLSGVKAQEHNWAFGFYGDVKLEDPFPATYGIQGKYEIGSFQGIQAQIHGRGGLLSTGIDYVVNILDKRTSNFNVFLGAGFSQDFYTYELFPTLDDSIIESRKTTYSNAVGQAGISYFFPTVDLSLFSGFKLKYQFKSKEIEPTILMFGLRYHIW